MVEMSTLIQHASEHSLQLLSTGLILAVLSVIFALHDHTTISILLFIIAAPIIFFTQYAIEHSH